MSASRLVWLSLRFYWRTYLAVALGVAVSAAVLVGALAVGDSVRYSLREMALARLGNVELAMAPQNRYFRSALASDLETQLNTVVAPILLLRGTAVIDGGAGRANHVQVVGVEDRFWALGGSKSLFSGKNSEEVVVNQRLAQQLNLKVGDEVLVRVEKPSLLVRDAPLSSEEDSSVALRLNVTSIAEDGAFGRFSLQANQIPPYNAFVPLTVLQEALEQQQRANALLVGSKTGETLSPGIAQEALVKRMQLADANIELEALPKQQVVEVRSDRIFLEPPVVTAANCVSPEGHGVLGYFVNELRVGKRAVPYSIVAAMQSAPVSSDLKDNEIVINEWTARDLQAKQGDTLTLSYYVVGRMRKLENRSTNFRISKIVPIKGAAADATLMPAFPGIAGAENCRDWEPGVNVDLNKIRPQDEAYWDSYRGAPKAFITLAAGQKLWDNRFGNLTAVRYPMQKVSLATAEDRIKKMLVPASIGLNFEPVRQQALAASTQAMDFGQLFLAFSFFLIVAALLLTALLFALGVEQRSEEIGTLLGLGFKPSLVRRLLLQEALIVAVIGSILGAAVGTFYTRAVLYGLSTIWRGAVGTSFLQYHAEPSSIVAGTIAGVIAAFLTIWIVMRKQAKSPARALLSGNSDAVLASSAGSTITPARILKQPGFFIALICGAITLILVATTARAEPGQQSSAFFGAGALLLIGTLALCHALLTAQGDSGKAALLTVGALGWRNSTRRRGRSLATMSLLACASFLIVAVGANRRDPAEGMDKRSSGTGGFLLFGESTLPVYLDLNGKEGQEKFGLEELKDVSFVQLRIHEGDDASCLNLNRAQTPRLLGVAPDELNQRGAFTFVKTINETKAPWLLLKEKQSNDVIPAIGDQQTVTWGLGKAIGDTLTYTNERGHNFKVRLVGILSTSILQGSLLIAEDDFVQHFPSESGYRQFLIDAPPQQAAAVTQTLSQSLEDVGAEVTPTTRRLAAFSAVENTYLSIFQVLGGLGLLLGSVGLGVVVLRNVLERRGELALLTAVGFRRRSLHWLVFSEHIVLLLLGLACGVTAALIAVLPALRSPGADVPYSSLVLTLCAVAISGGLWTWLATVLSLRGHMMNALRNE